MVILTAIFAALLAGSLAYCVLIIVASRRYLSVAAPIAGTTPPISLLKPLCGLDEGLEENLRSFFAQDYPAFEVLFAVHRADDPAVALVEKIRNEYAGRVETRLLITGDSPVPNANAHSLKRLVRDARHELLVMCDSDVRVTPDFLRHMPAEFQDQRVGLITCPYRAIAGRSA